MLGTFLWIVRRVTHMKFHRNSGTQGDILLKDSESWCRQKRNCQGENLHIRNFREHIPFGNSYIWGIILGVRVGILSVKKSYVVQILQGIFFLLGCNQYFSDQTLWTQCAGQMSVSPTVSPTTHLGLAH